MYRWSRQPWPIYEDFQAAGIKVIGYNIAASVLINSMRICYIAEEAGHRNDMTLTGSGAIDKP